jgi:hypothetical protein
MKKAILPDWEGGSSWALGATPGGAVNGLSGPAQPGEHPVLPQMAATLIGHLARRPDGPTEIALAPEELGLVRLTLQPDPGNPERVVVMLSFERPETMELFRRHADQLSDALRNAGYAQSEIGFGQYGADQSAFGRPDTGKYKDQGPEARPSALDPTTAEWTPPLHQSLPAKAWASLDLRL